MTMHDPTTPSRQNTNDDSHYHHQRRHRLPSSISGPDQVPRMMESRMGADEVLISSISWSAGSGQWGGVVHKEEMVELESDSMVGLVGVEWEEGYRRRKFSELFGLGGKNGKGKGKGKEKEVVVKKRKASRRLSEMVGFRVSADVGGNGSNGAGGNGVVGGNEKSGWKRRLSSFGWNKGMLKSPTRKDSVWPAAVRDDKEEAKPDHIVPQNTAADVINNYPYPSQASQYAWRRSHDAETISEHWTPGHSAANSETRLLRPESELFHQQENTQQLLEYLPQLDRNCNQSQWQELQQASSNLTLAHDQTISPAIQWMRLHHRAQMSLERVQQAYEEGCFSEAKIVKTFDDDRNRSPEAQVNARDDYLRVVAARQSEQNKAFEAIMQRHQLREESDRSRKTLGPDHGSGDAREEEQSKRSVGIELAQLAGIIGSSTQQAHIFM